MFKMERDPFERAEDTPEKSWDFFEKEEEEEKPEVKKKWFFEKDDDGQKPEPKEKQNSEASKDRDDDKKPKSESDRTLLTPEDLADMTPEQQKQALAKQYVANRAEQLQEELEAATPDSAEAMEISADIALIENLAEKLDNPDLEVDDAVEEAYQQIMERLDEILGLSEEVETEEDSEDEAETAKPEDSAKSTPLSPIFKPKKTPKPTKKTSTGSTSSSWSGPIKDPKSTPVLPPQNRAEVLHSATPESPKTIRQRRAGNLAVAEALNQMLSRRYESATLAPTAEATPIQSNPERVINPIRRSIAEKEERVRSLAIAQVVRAPEERAPVIEKEAAVNMPYLEGRPVSLEPVAPERAYYTTETPRSPEQVPSTQTYTKETSRNLQQASTAELLQIADKIKIDGTSLRNLFTSNQIDRNGLTKVIKEALKGGDVKSALKKATLGEEAQRGRKIEMRHDDPAAVITDVHSPALKASEARTNQILEALQSVNSVAQKEGASPFNPETEQEKALAEAAEKIAQKNRLILLSLATAVTIIVGGFVFVLLRVL